MMTVKEVTDKEKSAYNKVVSHVIQSWEWGEFREKLGLELVRLGHFDGRKLVKAYQLTFHPVPILGQTIGYLPKGPMPDRLMVDSLSLIGKKRKAAFIKLEPDMTVDPSTDSASSLQASSGQASDPLRKRSEASSLKNLGLVESGKSLFTKYNFLIDLTKSEDQLLAAMHPKTRYNIRMAQKHQVEVYDSTKDADFEIYLKLYFETTRRQKYFGHTPHYHRLLWQTLKPAGMARVLIARYQVPVVAWMLLSFGNTLYYPYGGSSTEHKGVMASNLVAWEAIRLGKRLGLKTFDMWGALGPQAKENDPWYGFHRFKAGYGAKLVEYAGTYDLVLKPAMYQLLNVADRLRWIFLRTIR